MEVQPPLHLVNPDDEPRMDRLIPVANQLQQILSQAEMFRELELPQIAVVGAQSTGKTTLLEALVGKSFLPKGDGMVTRCPLVLQLRKSPDEKSWAEFTTDKHVGNATKTYELTEVKLEIERVTNEIEGDKNISKKPIFLSIFSPDVTELTLVDLPGIIKVPVEGQPDDIEEQVNSLIRHYVENTSTIILAVSAANNDLANSDSLKLAKEVDPSGSRTIGVITKCDLSQNPAQTVDYIKGKIFRLRMGYVGLSNRVEGGDFFQQQNLFKGVFSYCGNAKLAKTLNTTLLHQLKTGLPEVSRKIDQNLTQDENELRALEAVGKDKHMTVVRIIHNYCQNFNDILEGEDISDPEKTDKTALYGGAKISYWFEDYFGLALRNFDPVATLTDEEIRTTIRNAAGTKTPLFVPDKSFEILVKEQIKKLEYPAMEVIQKVRLSLLQIAKQAETEEMHKFRQFTTEMRREIPLVMGKYIIPLQELIKDLLEVNCGFINTKHPDFVAALKAKQIPVDEDEKSDSPGRNFNKMSFFANAVDRMDSAKRLKIDTTEEIRNWIPMPDTTGTEHLDAPSEREVFEIDLIKYFIESYFKIVMTAVEDHVRKAVMSKLVKPMKEQMVQELVNKFNHPDSVTRVLTFSEEVQERILQLRSNVKALREAQDVMVQMQL